MDILMTKLVDDQEYRERIQEFLINRGVIGSYKPRPRKLSRTELLDIIFDFCKEEGFIGYEEDWLPSKKILGKTTLEKEFTAAK